jgi:hypothetical protein
VWKFEASREWVDSFISLHSAELTEQTSFPQEEPHLHVPRIFLGKTIRSMYEILHGCPADLVFNLDEVGISDWEDRKPRRVAVPITVSPHNIHHRISRNVKLISIMTYMAAGGACLASYVVTSQDSAALHRTLEPTGMHTGKHLILKHHAKPCINADLFENYIWTVFLPSLAITSIIQNIPEEDTAGLMDHCSLHQTPV